MIEKERITFTCARSWMLSWVIVPHKASLKKAHWGTIVPIAPLLVVPIRKRALGLLETIETKTTMIPSNFITTWW